MRNVRKTCEREVVVREYWGERSEKMASSWDFRGLMVSVKFQVIRNRQ